MRLSYLPFLFLLAFLTACGEKEVIKEEIIVEKTIDPDALPGMMHTVYFWLQPDISEEERQAFVNSVKKLETIGTVKRFFLGPPAGTENRGVVDNSFDYALICWFDDVAGHNAYQVDPIHLKFIEESEHRWVKVVVRDNELL